MDASILKNRLFIGGVAAVIAFAFVVAYANRESVIINLITGRLKTEIAETRPIDWMQGPSAASSSRPDGPPNIVFILADDLGMNDISYYGRGLIPTPNIDRLADQGAVFTNAYSGTATCAPSRAMLMTGRYPTRTGFEFTPMPPGMGRIISMLAGDMEGHHLPTVKWNQEADETGPGYAEKGLPPEEVTVAEVLGEAGYHNVHIGKWHLGREEKFRAVSQGFDESLLMTSGLFLPEDDPNVVNAKLPFDPIDRFLWAILQFSADYDRAGEDVTDDFFKPETYLTDYYTDEALKVIEANKNRPFFLYLAHWGVHTPLQASREDYDAVGPMEPHRKQVYAGMIRSIDRSVGRVLDKLEEEGVADNTIVVFSSDNGGAGYIGLPNVNYPYRGWKATNYEGGIRVPLFMKWPREIAPGTKIDDPVAHIDVFPTLAAAAGADLPKDRIIDGRNLLPAARGEGGVSREDNAIFWSSGVYRVVRAGDWKLHVNGVMGEKRLYNLKADPGEKTDLSERRADKVAELQVLIDAHYEDARPPLYVHSLESPIRIDKTSADPIEPDDEYIVWPN